MKHSHGSALLRDGVALLPLLLLLLLACWSGAALPSPVAGQSLLSSPSGLSVKRPLVVEGIDVGSTLVALQSQLQSQQQRLDQQQSRLDAQQQQIDELVKRNSSAAAVLQEFETRIGQLQQTIGALQTVVEQQTAQIAALSLNGTAAQQQQQASSSGLASLLAQQQAVLDRQQATVERLVERNSTVSSELQTLGERVAPLQSADAALAQQLQRLNASLSQSLSQHGDQLTELDASDAAQQTQIDELSQRSANASALLQQYEQRLVQIQQTIGSVQSVLDQQHSAIQQLQQNSTDSGLTATVQQQQTVLDRLVARNSTIERRLSSIEEQTAPLMEGDAQLAALMREVNASLSRELDEHSGQLGRIDAKIDALQLADQAIGQALTQQSSKLSLLNQSVSLSLAQQATQIGQLGLSLMQQATQLSQLNSTLAQSMVQQGAQLGQLGTQLSQVGQSLALQGVQLEQLGQSLSKLNSSVVQSLAQQGTQIGQMGTQLTQLGQSVGQQSGTISQLNTSLLQSLAQQSGQLVQLGQSVTQQGTQLVQLGGQLSLVNQSLSQSFVQQSGQLGQLSLSLTQQGGQITQLSQSLTQQGEQLGRLNTTVVQSLAQQGTQIGQMVTQLTQLGQAVGQQGGLISQLNSSVVQSLAQQGSQLGVLQQSLNQSLSQQSQLTTNVAVLLTQTATATGCYGLTAVAGKGGSVSAISLTSSGGCPTGFYATGTSVTVTALPSSGYEFAKWSGASFSLNSAVTVTLLDSAASLFASFRTESVPSPLPDQVIGQTDYYTKSRTSDVPKNGVNNPQEMVLAPNGDMYLADAGANRVLAFAPGATEPYIVLGQPNFLSSSTDRGQTTPCEYGFHSPMGLAIDANGGVLVADKYNNRVLYFAPGATSSTPATRVYGQSGSFTSSSFSPTSANSLYWPTDVAVGDGGVFIVDYYNFRILFYPNTSTTATRVIGQAGFTTRTSTVGASSLASPQALAVDGDGGLFVLDSARVLYFPPRASTATRVIGQPDFTSYTSTTGQQRLYAPNGLALRGKYVYVADSGNNRVIRFPANDTYPLADRLWGQSSFNAGSSPSSVTPTVLAGPTAVAFDAQGNMFVSDYYDGRVLRFPPQL